MATMCCPSNAVPPSLRCLCEASQRPAGLFPGPPCPSCRSLCADLKYDDCGEVDIQSYAKFSAMRDALNATGRSIVFSFEPHTTSIIEWPMCVPAMGITMASQRHRGTLWAEHNRTSKNDTS